MFGALLKEGGVNVDERNPFEGRNDNHDTCLIEAAEDEEGAVRLLAKGGASVDQAAKNGFTPLIMQHGGPR